MACPECGHVYKSVEALAEHTVNKTVERCGMREPVPMGIKCPKCGDYILWAEFWTSQYDKWGWERAEPVDIIDD